jgi:hypothetical protein
MEDDLWWSVFARVAAPIFFFLLGFAKGRTVPVDWIWLGVVLILLESWNAEWTWVAPNILLSLALIRIARPYVQFLLQREGRKPWSASCSSSAGTLWKYMPSSLLAPNSLSSWCPSSLADQVELADLFRRTAGLRCAS